MMQDEVYVKPGTEEVIEVILRKEPRHLFPDFRIETREGERYGFLGFRKAKENLYWDIWDIELKRYTRQECIDKFGVDPENDTRERFNSFVVVRRKSGGQITHPFDTENEAREWMKNNYPEFNTRI